MTSIPRLPLLRFLATAAAGFPLLCTSAQAQVTIGPPTQVDGGRGTQPCNDATISAAFSNPLEIVAAWNDYRDGKQRTGVGVSMDGGLTWNDFLLRAPVANQSNIEGQPMTCVDHRTGTIWAGGISVASSMGGIFVAKKNPGSTTFGAVTMARIAPGLEKGYMAAGLNVNDPDRTNVYCAYNEGLIRSVDMGATWSAPLSLGTGIGFNPKTGPAGELYIAYWDWNTEMLIRRSFSGGQNISPAIRVATRLDVWGPDHSHVAGRARVLSLPGLAVSPKNGHLFYVYTDTTSIETNGYNLDIYFCKSVNEAVNWTNPVVINTDAALPGDQFFPWIEVDRQGRIHMLFYDSRGVVQNDSDQVGFFDAYYSYSDDEGATWTESKLTSAPLRTDLAFANGLWIGDYIGLCTAGHRTLPLYMDTANGNADIFTNVIQDGPATEFCFGIDCPCDNEDPEAGCANLGSDVDPTTGSHLRSNGTSSVAADNLVLTFDGVKPNNFGLIFRSTTTGSVPFGDGNRCLSGALFRFPLRKASAAGNIRYGPNEIVGIDGPLPGDTRHYQGWYRDPLGPCMHGFNFSSAVTVAWQ